MMVNPDCLAASRTRSCCGFWIHREYTGKPTGGSQMFGGGFAVVGDVSAHFETARDFLGMFALNAGAGREIRWAAENEIKFFVRTKSGWLAEVASADVETVLHAVPLRRFFCERDALGLCFNGDESRGWQTPGGDHGDGSDAAAEVENGSGSRAPRRSIPSGQKVVGGKAVAFLQLEQAKETADRVQGFADGGWFLRLCARRNRSRFSPTFESRLNHWRTLPEQLCVRKFELSGRPLKLNPS